MSAQDNIAIVQQAYNNFKSGNIPGLLELLSDDVTWKLPEMDGIPFAGKRAGRDAVGEFFALIDANQENISFEPNETVAQGDKVVSFGHYQWRVKSTNREFSSDFAHVYTIIGGKITDFFEFIDTAAVVKAYSQAMSA